MQSHVNPNADKLFKKAMTAYNAGKRQQAEKLFKKILSKNTMHLDANFMLGNLYAMNARLQSAFKHLKQAARIKPDSIQVLNNLGNVLRLQNKHEEALLEYRKVLNFDPGFSPAIQNTAFCNFKLQHYNDAVKFFKQHLQANPDDIDSLMALAESYIKLEQHEQAIGVLQKCKHSDAADLSRIELLLASLGAAPLPERYPSELTLGNYKDKAKNWDADARRPDNHYRGPQLIEDALSTFLAEQSNLSIVDLGCGTGGCAPFLRPAAKRLLGVDLSPDMLALAAGKKIYDELIESDLENFLSSTSDTYDLITAAGVFILIGDLQAAFIQVHKVLAANGLFALTLYKGEDGVSLRHNLHFAHSRDYILEMAENSGLQVELLEEVIHETDENVPQTGFIVLLKKACPAC